MMKKRRLKLEELKVKSFVTLKEDSLGETIKGGARQPSDELVPNNPIKTILGCGPTPGTWCYICPVDELPEY